MSGSFVAINRRDMACGIFGVSVAALVPLPITAAAVDDKTRALERAIDRNAPHLRRIIEYCGTGRAPSESELAIYRKSLKPILPLADVYFLRPAKSRAELLHKYGLYQEAIFHLRNDRRFSRNNYRHIWLDQLRTDSARTGTNIMIQDNRPFAHYPHIDGQQVEWRNRQWVLFKESDHLLAGFYGGDWYVAMWAKRSSG